jgi:lantibiotic transport system permease protein
MRTALQQFGAAFKAETIKSKGTAAYWLTYLGPFFILLIYLLAFYFKGHLMLSPKVDPWLPFITQIWNSAAMVFLPMYLILLASQLLNLEHKNATWRLAYTLPHSKHVIFWSKLAMLFTLNLSAHLLTMLLTVATGMLLAFVKPDLGFTFTAIPWQHCAALLCKVLVCSFGILSIYYYICFEVKNQVKSMGIGISLFIVTTIVARWEYAYLIPTFYPMVSGMEYQKIAAAHGSLFAAKELLTVGGYFALFTLASWYRICTKRMAV